MKNFFTSHIIASPVIKNGINKCIKKFFFFYIWEQKLASAIHSAIFGKKSN